MTYVERHSVLAQAADRNLTTVEAILGSSRLRKDVQARRECARAMRASGLSYPEIARQLCRRSHTSVMYYLGAGHFAVSGGEAREKEDGT